MEARQRTLLIAALGGLAVLMLLCAGALLLWSAFGATTSTGAEPTAVAALTATAQEIVDPADEEDSGDEEAGNDSPAGGVIPGPEIVVLPTNTPAPTPIPTDTPAATDTPEATSTPEPTATNPPPPLQPAPPVVLPTNTPPPTSPPPPTEPPPPPAQDTRGVLGQSFSIEGGTAFGVNQMIWFNFVVANTTGAPIPFGALGVMPRKDGVDRPDMFQASWSNEVLTAGGLDWRDHIEIGEPGNYTLRLAICFDADLSACKAGGGTWATLSNEIPVNIY